MKKSKKSDYTPLRRPARGTIPSLVEKGLKGSRLVPGVRSATSRPCKVDKGKAMPLCRTEIVFLRESAAKKLGTRGGAHVRFCVADKQKGALVPVSSGREATTIANKFCECVNKKAQGGRGRCAEDVAGKVAFGRAVVPAKRLGLYGYRPVPSRRK